MFQIFVAECCRQNKFTEFFNSQAYGKNTICHKMHKFKCNSILAGFIFFQAIIGLAYKELGKFFCLRHSATKIWNMSRVKSKREVI
jgi:hypothetical protein